MCEFPIYLSKFWGSILSCLTEMCEFPIYLSIRRTPGPNEGFFFPVLCYGKFHELFQEVTKSSRIYTRKTKFPHFSVKKVIKCRLKNPALQTILVIFWATNSRYCAKFALRKKLAKTFVFSKQNKNKIVSLARSNCLKRKENCTIFSLALPTLWKTNCIYQSDHS